MSKYLKACSASSFQSTEGLILNSALSSFQGVLKVSDCSDLIFVESDGK